jgi:hypothetical protein
VTAMCAWCISSFAKSKSPPHPCTSLRWDRAPWFNFLTYHSTSIDTLADPSFPSPVQASVSMLQSSYSRIMWNPWGSAVLLEVVWEPCGSAVLVCT